MGGKKVFELMLEIGHKSQPLKAKLPNGYTHKWTVFVKGANNTRIEHCIQRVVFQLHDSFPNPHREITEPPFQIKETGYAGFEIPIQIYFKNRDKPNHLVFVLDLVLLMDSPHNSAKNQKVSFFNPNREFEKCLIKTGAQMILVNKEKKERSDSPPAKKQKSSSLIPSKDMAKQAAQTQANSQVASSNHHNHSTSTSSHHNSSQHHHHKSSHQNHHHIHNSSNHGNQTVRAVTGSNSGRPHNTHSNHHDSSSKSSSQHTSSSTKPKTAPKEFIDVFGAPLVVNTTNGVSSNNGNRSNSAKNHKSNGSRESATSNEDLPLFMRENPSTIPTPRIPHKPAPVNTSQPHSGSKSSHSKSHHKHHQTKPETSQVPHNQTPQLTQQTASQLAQPQQIVPHDPFQTIQDKISALTDCDRLQKIVDVIEESGEWYNLTASKFEFDLKRLDKKTLYKIEKCLKL